VDKPANLYVLLGKVFTRVDNYSDDNRRVLSSQSPLLRYKTRRLRDLFFLRIPLVSTMRYICPSWTNGVSIRIARVPAMSLTITLFITEYAFTSEDFPAWGFPTTAILVLSSSSLSVLSGSALLSRQAGRQDEAVFGAYRNRFAQTQCVKVKDFVVVLIVNFVNRKYYGLSRHTEEIGDIVVRRA
jgi:hypothetical protein